MSGRGHDRNIIEFFRQNTDLEASQEHLRGQADEIVTLFHKVLKGYKLYPISNPMFKRFAEDFKVKVDLMHTEIPVIPFRIKKTGFIFMKQPIETALDDNEVIYVLFNDGIREIYFAKGITNDEIVKFFNILAKVTVYASEDYDIATLLWDSAFEHIGYVTEEELIASEPFEYDDFDQGYDLNAAANQGRDLIPEKFSDRDVPFQDKQTYIITNEDKAIFAEQIQLYDENAVTARFLKELSLKLLHGTNNEVRSDLVDTASLLWERLLLFGAVKESVVFLKTLLKIGAQFRETNEEFYVKIKNGIANVTNDDFLNRVFKMADNFDPEQFEYFGDFLAVVPPTQLPTMIIKLTELQTKELRIAALEKLGKILKNPEVVKPLLSHADWHVVRNGLTVLKAIDNPAVVPLLRSIINHPQKQVRIESITVLMNYSVEEALPALEKAVFSPEKDIRLMSVDKLLELKNPQVKTVINRLLQEKHLASLDPAEATNYVQKIIDEKRQDLYDLLSVLLFSRTPVLYGIALKLLGKIDSTKPIVRHIVKFIDNPEFEKCPRAEVELFLPLIRPENFAQTIPPLEKILKLSGPLLKRDAFKDIKDAVITHLNQYRSDPAVKLFFKKGIASGNKETEELIRAKGGLL
ncbi:MAG TPA: HEAT repeat domain-containing protein [bacterium]|nr:HEAT repeat domain-containing protein [bacterium]